MAVELPTLTVTDVQADRLLQAFGTIENYQAWLTNALISYVIAVEGRRIDAEAATAKQAALDSLAATLPPTAQVPGRSDWGA